MLNLIKSVFRIVKLLLILCLLSCLVSFMVSNREIVTINFYPLPFNLEARIFVIVFLFFIGGMILGFFIFSSHMISKSIRHFKDHRKLVKLEKEQAKQITNEVKTKRKFFLHR